jgi:hypothetical protein
VKPLLWMRAIRRLVGKTPKRLAVLDSLALRMNADGAGFASTRQLADDSAASHSTVVRATKWARDEAHLVQVQRGHRLGNGRTMATRWQVTAPSQHVTSDTLSESQHVSTASQHVTREAPEVCNPEISSPTSYVTTGAQPLAANNGGRKIHQNEPNTQRAIATLITERTLPIGADELLDLAYRAGNGDPWAGYLKVKTATQESFAGARDPNAVLRKRLGVAT